MNFSYEIFPDRRAIVVRYVGTFTLEQLHASALTLWNDPRYARDYDGLVDVSHSSANVDITDFRAFVSLVRNDSRVSQGRWAAVVTTPFATACSFLYRSALASHHTFEIFSTWEAACEFLNLPIKQETLRLS